MAWRSHGHDAASLADALARNGVLRSERAAAAMRAVDRGHYLPRGRAGSAYEDAPQPIGHGVTISAPHMHAAALDLLEAQLRPGAAALDVGSGTGYLTACMAHMVRGTGARGDSSGVAVGIDHIDALVEGSLRNVRADPAAHELEQDGALELVCGDGRQVRQRAPPPASFLGATSTSRLLTRVCALSLFDRRAIRRALRTTPSTWAPPALCGPMRSSRNLPRVGDSWCRLGPRAAAKS